MGDYSNTSSDQLRQDVADYQAVLSGVTDPQVQAAGQQTVQEMSSELQGRGQ